MNRAIATRRRGLLRHLADAQLPAWWLRFWDHLPPWGWVVFVVALIVTLAVVVFVFASLNGTLP